jgi:hypothetical protein
LTAWRCRRARLTSQDAVAAGERLVLVVGPKAGLSDFVRQEWRFALQADKAITPILRNPSPIIQAKDEGAQLYPDRPRL